MKKSIKSLINLNLIIILILLIILFKNLNFFKSSYFLLNNNIKERQKNFAYDFCENNSSGYIFYLIDKFKLNEKPLIVNYNIEPSQDWIFKKKNIYKKSNKIIVLNYKKSQTYIFKKHKKFNYWVSYDMATPNTTKGGKYLEFIGKKINFNKEYKVNFYKQEIAVLTDVNKLKFNFKENINNYLKLGSLSFGLFKKKHLYILNKNNINFDDHDSLKFIKFENSFDDKNITEVRLHLNDKIDLSKFNILDNYENKCFLIEKYD